jgi:DNA transformation protein
MAVQPQYLEYILEQLSGLGALRPNRMFGGIGLYADGLFFGLIDDDTLFFKTDDTNIAAYRERNMPRFMPFPEKNNLALGYHQVPADVIEDAEMLVAWARHSVAVALASKARKSSRPRPKAKSRRKQGSKQPSSSKSRPKSKPSTRPDSARKRPAKKQPAKKAPPRKKSRR